MALVTQRLHITPNAFGVLDGRASDGTPVAPTLTWAPVPDYLQKSQGTPFSVDISVYLTSTSGDQITFSLLSGTWPSGWSISSDGVVSYDGSAIGAANVTIRATQDGTSADSNSFTVESIAVASADVLAPTIPTGLSVVSKTSTTINVSCDAPADISASDSVPYTGLKEVRFFKGGVLDGVSSTSAGLSLRLAQSSVTTGVTSGRRFTPGHYVDFLDSAVWSGTPYNGGTYTGIPNHTAVSDTGPMCSDSAGVVMRHRWSVLETAQDVYDMGPITSDLAQLATLSTAAGKTFVLYVMVEWRTFVGTAAGDNPMPAYLTSVADGGTGSTSYVSQFATSGGGGGWQGQIWTDTVKARIQKLFKKIGDTFNGNVAFAGIATQETSTGTVTDGGYSADIYEQAMKDIGAYAGTACPNARQLWYANFMSGTTNADATARLKRVAAALLPYGAIATFPDLVESGSILTRVYPIMQYYHSLGGYTGGSVQTSEWTANGNPAGQGWMTSLFNMLTGSFTYKAVDNGTDHSSDSVLKGDLMCWRYQTSAATGNHNQKYNSDSTRIQHDHPTFGTIAVGAGSTFTAGTVTQTGADYAVASLGSGIGSTGDEWTLGRVAITGNATIIAKLASVAGTTTTSAFGGLSFREDTTAGSKAVHLMVSPAGVASKYRSIAGSTATSVSSAATPVISTPTWLKFNRASNLFSFYYSTDGLAWTALGSFTLALNSSIYAEVFAGSAVTTPVTATFQQVCLQNLASPTYTYSGLTSSTAYSLTAVARDIALNDSAASPALSVTTPSVAVPAYTLRSVGTAVNGTGAKTPGAPAGVVAGDLLLLRADCRNNTETFSTPAGWTKISPNTHVTWSDLYARIATGSDTPPTMNSSLSGQIILQMACFTGTVYTDLSTIIHASVDKNGTNNDILYSALTVSLADCLIIACGAHNKTATSNGAVVTGLPGFTEIGQQSPNGSSLSSWWGYQQQTTATSLLAVTQTRSGTAESLQYTSEYIALRTT